MDKTFHGNWKIVEGKDIYIKVIGFPAHPDDDSFGSESMWVRKVSGTDNNGTGVLSNDPIVCPLVQHGDLVRYSGGTDREKPRFVEVLEN